jgi:hypothetical protein
MKFYLYRLIHPLLPCFFIALLFSSCDKFQGDQTVPAYIHIDDYSITTSLTQGSASDKITDVWINASEELIGAFEMPCTFPVLKSGRQLIQIRAGIKMNGIANSRIAYPFYKPDTIYADLIPGQIITLKPTSTYFPQTVFVWNEDFEQAGLSIEKTTKSDTGMMKTSDHQLVFEGGFSGVIYLSDTNNIFEGSTVNSWTLPKNGTPIFLEMNYRNNNLFTVGVIGTGSTQVVQEPVMVLNHSDNWNKIYINLTPTVDGMTNATEFKIFFGALKESGVTSPRILIDNVKLVRF